MKKTLDLSKPVQTRQGWPARILCTDLKGEYPVLAAVTPPGGCCEQPKTFTLEGNFSRDDNYLAECGLVNIPEIKTLSFNFYGDEFLLSTTHFSTKESDKMASRDRAGRVDVTLEKLDNGDWVIKSAEFTKG